MWTTLLNTLFGCMHRKTTFPLTSLGKNGSPAETYVVCLDCGTEFQYDWQEMRIRKALTRLSPTALQASVQKLTEANGSTCRL
jgi:hypothetical protein